MTTKSQGGGGSMTKEVWAEFQSLSGGGQGKSSVPERLSQKKLHVSWCVTERAKSSYTHVIMTIPLFVGCVKHLS
jgi:hypothetical protein